MHILNKASKEQIRQIDNLRYDREPTAKQKERMSLDTSWFNIDDIYSLLSPPPKNTSQITMNELAHLEKMTSSLSDEDVDLIKMADHHMYDMFENFCKENGLEYKDGPITTLVHQADAVTLKLKYHFNRPRPEQLKQFTGHDVNVYNTSTTKTPSYPSGHTSQATIMAYALSDKHPDYKDEFFKLAFDISRSRELMGVHYPTDNAASMLLCEKLYLSI